MKKKHLLYIAVISLAIGFLTYWIETTTFDLPATIRNHLADGLWATSFVACICYVWNDNAFLCYTWSAIAILSMLTFEMLQYLGQIKGTGDPLDAVVYIAFSLPVVAISQKYKL